MEGGLCSGHPRSPQCAHRCLPASAAAAAAPAAQHPWPLAHGPCWPYLRVGEIVEEEGGELFVQQRAAVVPRHLPAAAAACGGVSAEPAGGRERGREGGRREEGARPAGGGGRSSGPGCRRAAGCGGGAARCPREPGVGPPLSCATSVSAILARSPRPGGKRPQPGDDAPDSRPMPAQQCGQPPAPAGANHVALALGGSFETTCFCTAGETEAGEGRLCVKSRCMSVAGRRSSGLTAPAIPVSLPELQAQRGRNTIGQR